ncbi:MAG TPA: hypothetical protein VJ783_15590 [Pirellulales bacterium]|nr:hypothetical protein [Pirellulales bacterium]
MPGAYDKLGIHFQFPDSWRLDEADALAGEQSVTVYSPDGAFWSVMVHPPTQELQPLADASLETMKQVYDELDAEAVRETVAGIELLGYDINFYCLDLTNTALVRACRTAKAAYLILCQADDREFDQIESVFRAITQSLLVERNSFRSKKGTE